MKKPANLTVTIPEPCTENWNKMTANGNGRHCSSCNKTVVDFSKFTDKELVEFLKKVKGTICGRISEYQVNRAMPIPVQSNNSFFHKALFGTAIAAGLTATAKGQTEIHSMPSMQVPVPAPPVSVPITPPITLLPQEMVDQVKQYIGELPLVYSDADTLKTINPIHEQDEPAPVIDSSKHWIKGIVRDEETNKPLQYASVYLDDGTYSAETDSSGAYTLFVPDSLMNKDVTIEFSCWEHAARQEAVKTGKEVQLNAKLKFKREIMKMGKMVMSK
jgi:hypothetical protein